MEVISHDYRNLQPFNIDASCRKCGADASIIKTKYCPPLPLPVSMYDLHYAIDAPKISYMSATMERTCCRCDYKWQEEPLDADRDSPPETVGTSHGGAGDAKS